VLRALLADLLLRCLARAIGLWEKVKRHVPVTFLRVVRDFLLRAWCSSVRVALAQTLL